MDNFQYSEEMRVALEFEERLIEYLPNIYKNPKMRTFYIEECMSRTIFCDQYKAKVETVLRSFTEQEARIYTRFLKNHQKIVQKFIRTLADNYPRGLDKGAFCAELREFVRYFGTGAYFANEAERQGLCGFKEIVW